MFAHEGAPAYVHCINTMTWPPPPEPLSAIEARAEARCMRDQNSGDWYWTPNEEDIVGVCVPNTDPLDGK